jgi:RNA polymerase sigma-70 factor (ECF subfamily)
VARAIVLTHEDAEDAVQEGFLHAYRALDRFLPDQAFGAWLHRIVANAALDITRRKKVRDADALADTIASPFRDPGESDELRRRLRRALTTLGERQRAVIVLHDIEGFKHSEIGRMLGSRKGRRDPTSTTPGRDCARNWGQSGATYEHRARRRPRSARRRVARRIACRVQPAG